MPCYVVLTAHAATIVAMWLFPDWFDHAWAMFFFAPAQLGLWASWAFLSPAKQIVPILVGVAVLAQWITWSAVHTPPLRLYFCEPLAYCLMATSLVGGSLFALRVVGYKVLNITTRANANAQFDKPAWPQYTLRQIGIFVTAVSLAFAVGTRWPPVKDVLADVEIGSLLLFTVASTLLAVWATLGHRRLAMRLMVYASVTVVASIAWAHFEARAKVLTWRDLAEQLPYLLPNIAIVPITLLAFRVAGYRLTWCPTRPQSTMRD